MSTYILCWTIVLLLLLLLDRQKSMKFAGTIYTFQTCTFLKLTFHYKTTFASITNFRNFLFLTGIVSVWSKDLWESWTDRTHLHYQGMDFHHHAKNQFEHQKNSQNLTSKITVYLSKVVKHCPLSPENITKQMTHITHGLHYLGYSNLLDNHTKSNFEILTPKSWLHPNYTFWCPHFEFSIYCYMKLYLWMKLPAVATMLLTYFTRCFVLL